MFKREPIDLAAYIHDTQTSPCFICGIVRGDESHRVIYEDEHTIAFLNKFPTLYSYALVSPKTHREQVTGDFTSDEYLMLQQVIYRVGEAIRHEVPTERLYILSVGSQQGNRHVHWHVAPLPPGVPYEQQQFSALTMVHGVLAIPDAEMDALAKRLRARLLTSPLAPCPQAERGNNTLASDDIQRPRS